MSEQSSGNTRNSVGVVPIETLRSMSGLEFFEGVMAGKLPRPPMSAVLRFDFVSAEKGFVVFKGEPASDFYNPLGSVHGGWTATLLDSCMGCAVHSMLEAGQGYTTIEFKVSFVRPITDETGTLFAEGRIINFGRSLATAEGRLVDPSGKLYAHATTTCFILGR